MTEASTSSYRFTQIQPINLPETLQETFLWVLHADKAPPHIGISSQGKYFSLKANSRDFLLNVSRLWMLIEQKQIPTLLVRVPEVSMQMLQLEFEKYQSITFGNSTCLTPLVNLLLQDKNCALLADLLHALKLRNQLGTISGLNLPPDFCGLPSYTPETIQLRIKALQDAKRRTTVFEGH